MSFPDSWDTTRLSDERFFQLINGLWKGKTPPFTEASVIRNTNFDRFGTLDLSDVAVLPVESRQLEKRKLKYGDVIIERSGGGPKQPVGRACLFDVSNGGPYSFSNFTSVVRVTDEEAFSARFVAGYLLHLYESGRTVPLQRATTGLRNLDWSAYTSLPIPRPPFAEQQRITRILELAHSAVAVEWRWIEQLRELRVACLRQLFTRGVLSERLHDTPLGQLPASWKVEPLEKVCTFLSGGTPSKSKPEFWAGPIPWASPKDLKLPRLRDTEDHISDSGLAAGSKLAPKGSVLVVVRGMILAKDVPVALAAVPMAINQDLKAIVAGERLEAEFLLYALTALKERLFQKIGRSAHGTRTLLSHELASFVVPVPDSIDEQRSIARSLRAIDLAIEVHEKSLRVKSELFGSFLDALMTGDVRTEAGEVNSA